MSLPPKPTYAIAANDRYALVRVGAKVAYSLVRTNIVTLGADSDASIAGTEDAISGEYTLGHPYTHDRVVQPHVRWDLFPENALRLERVGEAVGLRGASRGDNYVLSVRWEQPGVHVVRCFIESPPAWGDAIQVASQRQVVVTAQEDAELFADDWDAARFFAGSGHADADAAMTSPERVATEIFRTLTVAEQLEREHPTKDPAVRKAYEDLHRHQSRFASKLYELLLTANAADHRRYAVLAMHSNPVDNVHLRLFVAIGREPRVSREDQVGDRPLTRAEVIDWTDAQDAAYSGNYRGAGDDAANALASALLQWARASKYPDGELRFELPPTLAELLGAAARAGRLDERKLRRLRETLALDLDAQKPGLSLEGRFPTAAPTDPDALAVVLDRIALASAVVAIALVFAAPVPGSRVVAALLWTSAVTGAGASTVRLATRHARSISDPMATAIDVLGIVSSVLMLPSATAMWRQGAKVAIREAVVTGSGKKVLKMALVGQIVADGLSGALIGTEALGQLKGVLSDRKRDPMARLTEAAKLLAQLTATGALVVVGAKANVEDLAKLHAHGDAGLRRLGDPDAKIDLTDGAGSAGDTKKGRHLDIADIDPPADGRMVTPRVELTPAARAVLGELDAASMTSVRRMLDADGVGANLLFERFGRAALDIAGEFAAVWKRWGQHDLPIAWLRLYHKHTGLHGVRYFAKLPDNAAGRDELTAGGWACQREEHFHSLHPSARHSVARHGPHIPDGPRETLEARVTTGFAADVAEHGPEGARVWGPVASPSDRSTRFLSFVDWLQAHDSAYLTLAREHPGMGQFRGPIRGSAGQAYPKAGGYLRFGCRPQAGGHDRRRVDRRLPRPHARRGPPRPGVTGRHRATWTAGPHFGLVRATSSSCREPHCCGPTPRVSRASSTTRLRTPRDNELRIAAW